MWRAFVGLCLGGAVGFGLSMLTEFLVASIELNAMNYDSRSMHGLLSMQRICSPRLASLAGP